MVGRRRAAQQHEAGDRADQDGADLAPDVGNAETNKAATTASVARSRSGASERIIARTALATTATAATFNPCSQPLPSALPSEVTP